MKITEKLYIARLEGMLKYHRDDPCHYCPMGKYFSLNEGLISSGDTDGYSISCKMCQELTHRYAYVKCDESIKKGWCPCEYFRCYFNGDFETPQKNMPKDYMVKVAWKVIRGWKKNHKVKRVNS